MVAGFNFPMTVSPGRMVCGHVLFKHETFTGWVCGLFVFAGQLFKGAATLRAGGPTVNSICLVQSRKSGRGFCAMYGMKQDFQ